MDRLATAELGLPCHTYFGRTEETATSGGMCRVEKRPSGRYVYLLDGRRLKSLDELPRPVLEGLRDAQRRLQQYDQLLPSLGDQRYRVRLYPLDPARRQWYGALAGREVSLPPAAEPFGAPRSHVHQRQLRAYLAILSRFGPHLERLLDGLNDHAPKTLWQTEMVIENLFHGEGGDTYREVKILATLGCNQRCLFCCAREPRKPFPAERIRTALSDLQRRSHGTQTLLSFSGGEPTLHPDLPDLLRLSRRLGFTRLGLQTNGIALGRPDLLDALLEVGLQQIIFSLHSHRPHTYDLLTGTRGQLAKARENLAKLLTHPIGTVMINIVINRHNVDEVPDYADFVASLPHHPSTSVSVMPSIVYMEQDNGRWAELALPYREVASALSEAAGRHPRLFVPQQGDCFLPFCLCAPYPELAPLIPHLRAVEPTAYLEHRRPAQIPRHQRIKHADCRTCLLDSRCGGLCGEYARSHGLAELSPITDPGVLRPSRADPRPQRR